MSTNEFGGYLSISFNDTANNLTTFTNGEFLKHRFLPFANSPIYNTTITKIKQLTKGEDVKSVYDVTLGIQDHDYEFEPGDTIGILPCNDKHEVEQLFDRLNLKSVMTVPYTICILNNTTKKKPVIPPHIPVCGTLQDLFLNHLDIRSVPKKLFLRSLTRYTTVKEEFEKLQFLCSPNGSEEYKEFIINNRTLLDQLSSFPSCQPPVERLLENLPPLQPRPYSISCSPLLKELHITFSVITTEWGAKGVCSGWLESLTTDLESQLSQMRITHDQSESSQTDKNVQFYYRKINNFRLPTDPMTPIIMIGPGTGVAPFVGFLQHRYLLNKEKNIKFGCSWLFYGCRYSKRDFLYKKEMEEYLQMGTLTRLFTCFSRESSEQVYVQDLIKQHGKDFVNKIVHENAIVYVCGDATNMAKDVRKAIVSCLVDFEKLSEIEAENFMKNLEQSKRYIQDVWI
ncbi:hypothetical protein ILUMI_06786 [Ignelater luminosus]|uniref:Methionine synthase reductase n=1 Tax=Ignelater luminosus TaxID=2038154 RepID=A0A8K0D9J8_IGNLU|nr:hypothetical protein ILUMI_06786 [Ignelater luminosus]